MMTKNIVGPYSSEGEVSIICGIMRYPSLRPAIFPTLEPDDFYAYEHQHIYKALKDMDEKGVPVDIHTVVEFIKSSGENLGRFADLRETASYLAHIYSQAVLGAQAGWFAERIKNLSTKRKIMKLTSECYEEASNEATDPSETINRLNSELNGIAYTATSAEISHDDAIREVAERVLFPTEENRKKKLMSGLIDLDRITGGFVSKQLIIIGARPGVGKSMFGLTIADNMAKKGKFVFFVTIEMTADELAERQLSFASRVELTMLRDHPDLLSEKERGKVQDAVERLLSYEGKIIYNEEGTTNPSRIRMRAKQLKNTGRLDCIIIDYLQLVTPDKECRSTVEAVSQTVYAIKSIAKELDVPVIALAQLNREVEKRGGDTRPLLTDLRESGAIEQAADVAIMIHRDMNVEDLPAFMDTELIVRKNRSGRVGTAHVLCETGIVHFTNMDRTVKE